MNRKFWGIVLALIIAMVLGWQYTENREVSVCYLNEEGVAQCLKMPEKDRELLTHLMEQLFAQGSFAYTLLGSKPVSWDSYQNPFPLTNWISFYESFFEHNRRMRSGWKTWEKYRNLFPKTLLWMERSTKHPGVSSILIVNNESLKKVVEENHKDFLEVLGRDVDGSQLIFEAQEDSFIYEVLKGHQALIGIVLGYGRNNAWLFHIMCEHRAPPIGWVWGNDEAYFGEDQEDGLDEAVTPYYLLCRYSCTSFSGDSASEESIALKKEYSETKRQLKEYYKDKDFLEATLSLLAGYRPGLTPKTCASGCEQERLGGRGDN